MKRRTFLMFAASLPCLAACATPTNAGPGMSVTFASLIGGRSMNIKSARLPNGKTFNGVGLTIGGIRTSN